MKILQVHNSYQQRGGEDAVVAAEGALLSSNDHEVRLFSVSNDSVRSLPEKLRAGLGVAYSGAAREQLSAEIRAFRPDLVHAHNWFPLLTPSVYDACRDNRVPVVQTLHNYRTVCPGALLMRGGKICEECLNGSAYRAVLRRCYRGSLLGTLAVARMVEVHRRRRTWLEKVDRFVVLSEFSKSRFLKAGFPSEKISVKPNFAADPGPRSNEPSRSETVALFVGRLSAEKGIGPLLDAWRQLDVPLRVVGDGPAQEEAEARRLASVQFLGRRTAAEVAVEMGLASFLVVPSLCYENFPLTVAEAFAHGVPVIASRLGALEELVEEGRTGLLFEPGNTAQLAEKVRWAATHPSELVRMGENARRRYERDYTPERNYEALMRTYERCGCNQKRLS